MKNLKPTGTLLSIFCFLIVVQLQAQTASTDSLMQKQTIIKERLSALKATLAESEMELKAIDKLLAPPPPKWTYKGIGGISVSQSSFTNWNAGGENSVVSTIYLNAEVNYAHNKWLWNTAINTIFGKSYTPAYNWFKADDNLNIVSKAGFSLLQDQKLYASFLASFQTQYDKGKKSPKDANYISNWMAPGYLNLAAGLDYKPWKWASVFFSPVNGRLTFVNDTYLADQDAFGIGVGEKFDARLGMLLSNKVNVSVTKNISFISKLDLFTSYDDDFGNIVTNWDGMLAMKVSKVLTTTVNWGLRYDDDVKTSDISGNPTGAKIQFKQLIGMGLAYTF